MCREHWRQGQHSEKPREVSAEGIEGEEVNVPGYMPPVAQTLLPIFRLGGFVSGSGGDSNHDKVIYLPGHQVAATLIKDVRVHQE